MMVVRYCKNSEVLPSLRSSRSSSTTPHTVKCLLDDVQNGQRLVFGDPAERLTGLFDHADFLGDLDLSAQCVSLGLHPFDAIHDVLHCKRRPRKSSVHERSTDLKPSTLHRPLVFFLTVSGFGVRPQSVYISFGVGSDQATLQCSQCVLQR